MLTNHVSNTKVKCTTTLVNFHGMELRLKNKCFLTGQMVSRKNRSFKESWAEFFYENNGSIIFKLNIHISTTGVSRRPQKTQK